MREIECRIIPPVRKARVRLHKLNAPGILALYLEAAATEASTHGLPVNGSILSSGQGRRMRLCQAPLPVASCCIFGSGSWALQIGSSGSTDWNNNGAPQRAPRKLDRVVGDPESWIAIVTLRLPAKVPFSSAMALVVVWGWSSPRGALERTYWRQCRKMWKQHIYSNGRITREAVSSSSLRLPGMQRKPGHLNAHGRSHRPPI
jgi:hypothetical protein